MIFMECNSFVQEFEKVIKKPKKTKSKVYYTGVDLGTACVVIAVLDENKNPVAGAYRFADVVKDGMVVDYIGAVRLVREMKEEIEEKLGVELVYSAAAIPPGTDALDGGAVKNVVQAAGFEVTALLDESTAANNLLKIKDGAVVDIGGGTTGISIFKDGKVELIDDEPTGGTHLSLVISGSYKMNFEEADKYKMNVKNHREIFPIVKPVIEKIATIIEKIIEGHEVKEIYLVGGSSCLTGIENLIQSILGIPTYKPENPMFITPIGIALGCTTEIMD
ncbi:ethanolamine utilization protein EutJ [Eubacteriales bacterium KG127]